MRLHFRVISPDEVEKEVTQRDQFDSDEVELIEALIREAHQNSIDAQDKAAMETVRTRIAFHVPTKDDHAFLAPILAPLRDHLLAAGVEATSIDFGNPRFLVVEDFGTTGLSGAWDRKDNNPFSDFWRRVGKSHKGGTSGGRWGLGKLVFSSASQSRTFFGITVRSDDASRTPLLMGQAVLSIHSDPSTKKELDGVGFFCELADNGLQLPEREPGMVTRFARAVGIKRTTEPGLSIAIPFVRTDLTKEGLIRSLLRNYYFPILISQLESEIEDTEINAESFDSLAREYGGDRLEDGRLVTFVRDLRTQLDKGSPNAQVEAPLTRDPAKQIPESVVEELRKEYASGKLVHVRLAVTLKNRHKGTLSSFIDAFLRATDGEGQGLVVRGGITLPGEATEFRSRKCFGALLAADDAVAEFLGDAENPAHTKWNRNAEKLNANWVNGSARLSEIRSVLNSLYNAVAQAPDAIENDAFLELISVKGPTGGKLAPNRKPIAPKPPASPIPRRKQVFDLRERKGGFAVLPGDAVELQLPIRIRVEAAYGIFGGDPFKRFSEVDFDFRTDEIAFETKGGSVETVGPNTLVFVIDNTDFSLAAKGFDTNRDLEVRARVLR